MATVLLRYGEIGLKGQNQRFFVDALTRNIRRAVADLGPVQVRHVFGRILADSAADVTTVVERLRRVFGVVSLSPVRVVAPALDEIRQAALEMAAQSLGARPDITTFKVDTRRADKRFPLTSMETSREVGEAVRQRFPQLRARMTDPDLVVQV